MGDTFWMLVALTGSFTEAATFLAFTGLLHGITRKRRRAARWESARIRDSHGQIKTWDEYMERLAND